MVVVIKSGFAKGLAALTLLALSSAAASAMQVDILVNKVTQHLIVKVDGVERYDWLVSSGAPTLGYDTPSGDFHIFRMEKEHFSKEWDDAPMPYSMFFTAWGHAIHGSYHVKGLGSPVSHGCVRLLPANAEILFGLVKEAGFKNNTVSIRGAKPGLFQAPEALLTTDETFHMPQKEHVAPGTAIAAVAPASATVQHPFWWLSPPVKKVDVVKVETPKKKLKKLAKKKKKLIKPDMPAAPDVAKDQQQG
jgi:hypothetical protein